MLVWATANRVRHLLLQASIVAVASSYQRSQGLLYHLFSSSFALSHTPLQAALGRALFQLLTKLLVILTLLSAIDIMKLDFRPVCLHHCNSKIMSRTSYPTDAL